MKLSIVMACWNKASFVKTAITSIENQTVKPDELLFIDDNSDDNSLEIIKSLRRKVSFPIRIFETHKSLTHNCCLPCNIGFKRAKGDVILINGADLEHVKQTNLERMMKWHQKKNKILLTPELVNFPNRKSTITASSVRKEFLFKIKGYDERMFGWGANEPDITYRLGLIGVKWIKDKEIKILHRKGSAPSRAYRKENDLIHARNSTNAIYCPNKKWGEHPNLEEIL